MCDKSSDEACSSAIMMRISWLSVVQEAGAGGHRRLTQLRKVVDDMEWENTCAICMANTKAWGFRHGRTVHVCACEGCVKTCFKERKICPVCNLPADDILQVFSS
jgi:hypothetical protein